MRRRDLLKCGNGGAVGAGVAARGVRAGGLSGSAGAADRAVPAGRRLRHHRPAVGRPHQAASRHGGHREHRRRRRRRRRGPGGAFAAGRLHAAARRRDHPHHRGAAQDQADVRSAQGPGADLSGRGDGLRHRGSSVGAGQRPQGAGGLRQSQSGQDVLRLRRPRLAQSSHRRTVQAQDRAHRFPACAVSRRGAGADRSAGRANSRARSGDDQHRGGASPRRQAQGARGDARQASGGGAGIADRGGAGLSGSGGAELHRRVRADRRAEGDRRCGLRGQPEAVRRQVVPGAADLRHVRARTAVQPGASTSTTSRARWRAGGRSSRRWASRSTDARC